MRPVFFLLCIYGIKLHGEKTRSFTLFELKIKFLAWGVLQNRSGKVIRQFSADLNGKWDGKQLILDEKFNWDDGEVQTRQWHIPRIKNNKETD